jgi:hypothetical protein
MMVVVVMVAIMKIATAPVVGPEVDCARPRNQSMVALTGGGRHPFGCGCRAIAARRTASECRPVDVPDAARDDSH